MGLSVVHTTEGVLVSEDVRSALSEGITSQGVAVLLVPSFAQALDAQRTLASVPGLALGVTTTTPGAWLKEFVETWGDGRTLADGTVLSVLARQTIVAASEDELGPMRLSAGLVQLLARLADRALPWLPLDKEGHAQVQRCHELGLTEAETLLMGLVGALGNRLASHGYVTQAQASVIVPDALAGAAASVPPVVVAGFARMERRERELLHALGELTEVTVVLGQKGQSLLPQQDPGLRELVDTLFSDRTIAPAADGPVEFLLATGPVAEAELIASRVAELAGDPPVAVAVPDITRATRELVPKLAARGLRVRVQQKRALLDTSSFCAFLSFARTVAQLSELAASWPEPEPGLDGLVPQLGDMSWWPPRELGDFLLSDLSGMEPERAWRLDALWRGNRLLTPMAVLESLQSERETSAPVARATAELLRGRLGSAASKLLAPFVYGDAAQRSANLEAQEALQAVLRIAGTLRELGVSGDPAAEGSVSLSELVRLCAWAAEGMNMTQRQDVGPHDGPAHVLVMSRQDATTLAPGCVQALVLMGCTTEEQPIGTTDDLLQALLETAGVEPPADPMADERDAFLRLVCAPTRHLVLERALNDADGKETYPSVMLSELLAAFGIAPGTAPDELGLPMRLRTEDDLERNCAALGERQPHAGHDDPAPAGRLTARSRDLVFVPQEGREQLPDDKPILSASQVETYLDCPYKWFSLRRLRLGSLDAIHGGAEMGTFAHRVMERTHGILFARALDVEAAESDEKLLRELGEAHLVDHLPGSYVDAHNLEEARAVLEHEFDLHQQHMLMVRKPRLAQQLLVAHDSFERAQEAQLKQDLLSCLEYQTRVLRGFEPRLFEWDFGRHELVLYAGAYFTGTVDRIDVSPHGTAVIVDYKHKSPTGFAAEYDALQKGVLEGTILPNRVQSLIYAQVVRRAFAGQLRLVGTVYLATKAPHALAGAADDNVADLVFGSLRAPRQERVCVPATPEGASGMEELLDRTEELVAEQVAQMLAGNVEANPRDWRSCSYCPVMQCERRKVR